MPTLSSIFHATPNWVFALFLLLLWMGLRQCVGGAMGLARATLVPLGMAGWSLFGALSTLGGAPAALALWAVAATAACALLLRLPVPAGLRYDAAARVFQTPGSPLPLALMMGVFLTKYVAGVALAMHPALRQDSATLLLLGLLYGAFSGVFAGRAARLLRLVRRQPAAA